MRDVPGIDAGHKNLLQFYRVFRESDFWIKQESIPLRMSLGSQTYISSVLDVVDAAVGDADAIASELRQMTTILDRDVNYTDISAGITVRSV